jgi:hypothetical protein
LTRTFLVLAVTVKGRALLEILNAGKPCTDAPMKDDLSTAEDTATVGVAMSDMVAAAAMVAVIALKR